MTAPVGDPLRLDDQASTTGLDLHDLKLQPPAEVCAAGVCLVGAAPGRPGQPAGDRVGVMAGQCKQAADLGG
jgi:hypothetical protein